MNEWQRREEVEIRQIKGSKNTNKLSKNKGVYWWVDITTHTKKDCHKTKEK
jgi:hypothetical protein